MAPNWPVDVLESGLDSGYSPQGLMETLQANIEVQEQCLSLVQAEYLGKLKTSVQHRTDAGKPVTLALYTRQFRLARLLQVLEELIALELQLLRWYQSLEEDEPEEHDLHAQVQTVIATIEKASRRMERDWSTNSPGGEEDEEEVPKIPPVTGAQLEKKIARLHEALEAVLKRFKNLTSYLKYYDLLPSAEPQTQSVKFYGHGMVRAEEATLQSLLNCARLEEGEEDKHYCMLDTPKVDILLHSLPSKYMFPKET